MWIYRIKEDVWQVGPNTKANESGKSYAEITKHVFVLGKYLHAFVGDRNRNIFIDIEELLAEDLNTVLPWK